MFDENEKSNRCKNGEEEEDGNPANEKLRLITLSTLKVNKKSGKPFIVYLLPSLNKDIIVFSLVNVVKVVD